MPTERPEAQTSKRQQPKRPVEKEKEIESSDRERIPKQKSTRTQRRNTFLITTTHSRAMIIPQLCSALFVETYDLACDVAVGEERFHPFHLWVKKGGSEYEAAIRQQRREGNKFREDQGRQM
jgi:hypothetical protein